MFGNNEEVIGKKNDEGKARWDLLDMQFTGEVVNVLTAGAEKYGANNWQNVEDAENRYFAALMRHIVAYRNGEDNDPEDGLPHLAHAACNLMFLQHFIDENTLEE